jgi:hypothetical protein
MLCDGGRRWGGGGGAEAAATIASVSCESGRYKQTDSLFGIATDDEEARTQVKANCGETGKWKRFVCFVVKMIRYL